MLRVGLTGGIATGKSRVLARLKQAGLHAIDLDLLGHAVIEPGRPAHDEVVAAFGPSIVGPDGRIDRRALGAIVFSDTGARRRLNAIVHPRIFEEEARVIATLRPGPGDVVVSDATLFVEGGHHVRFDRLIVTTCDRRQQIARLMHRDGLSAGAAQARVESQMPAAEKARFGHDVIDTSAGSVADTDAAADALARELQRLAARWTGPAPVDRARAAAALAATAPSGPRGLTPRDVLQAFADPRGAPLRRLAERLVPPHDGPWYEAAASNVPGPDPTPLMPPVVLWSLAWHGPDAAAMVAAAVSVARLTHTEPAVLARAAAAALTLWEVARSGAVPVDLESVVRGHGPLVERWTGVSKPPAPAADVDAALLRALTGDAAAGPVPADLTAAFDDIDRAALEWRFR